MLCHIDFLGPLEGVKRTYCSIHFPLQEDKDVLSLPLFPASEFSQLPFPLSVQKGGKKGRITTEKTGCRIDAFQCIGEEGKRMFGGWIHRCSGGKKGHKFPSEIRFDSAKSVDLAHHIPIWIPHRIMRIWK